MMKRLLFFALSAVLLFSCKKTDEAAPSITWPSNTKFAVVEMGTNQDSNVSVSAPAKIESLELKLGLGEYVRLANRYIEDGSKNKGTKDNPATLDVIDDSKSAEFLRSLNMTSGVALRGRTISTLNLEAILNAIITGEPVDNNTSFTIDIILSDQAGKEVTKTAKFHFTSPPEIVWQDNQNNDLVDLNEYSKSKPGPSKVKISAPGKIKDLTVTLEYGADAALAKYVQNRVGNLTIDLINDSKAESEFGFPAKKVLEGKTDAVLDFAFIYGLIPDIAASTNVFTVKVVDANEKICSMQLKFKK